MRTVIHLDTRALPSCLLPLNPVLSLSDLSLLNRASLDVLLHLLDRQLGIKRTSKALVSVLDGIQHGRHKGLELTALQTSGNDKSSHLGSVHDISTLGGGGSNSAGSVTLVEVFVTLLGGHGKSLVSGLLVSVEQVEHVSCPVLFIRSQELGDERGSHFVVLMRCDAW